MKIDPPSELFEELRRQTRGEVLFDDMTRLIYSTDASLYQIKPAGVFLPRTAQDIIQAIRIAVTHGVPILPRGGGTSLAGQTVSNGLVIDCSKYLTEVVKVDPTEGWAQVQPGVVLDNLNDFLSFYGLFFAPDVATSSRANVGGMIGNNSAGVRSVRYGKTVDKVQELSVVLSTGESLELRELNASQLQQKCALNSREGEIYRRVVEIVRENREEILRRYPRVMRRVGGYNLDELLDSDHFNLAHLVVGSEGTLAFVTEARVKLDPIPRARVMCVAHFDDLLRAIRTVPLVLRHAPSAVEILDRYGLDLAEQNPSISVLCHSFIQGTPEAILMIEFSADSEAELRHQVAGVRADVEIGKNTTSFFEGWTAPQQKKIWEVRKNALGIMLGIRGDYKPLPFIEDSAVPVEHLGDYIERVQQICRDHNRSLALYAHASVGLIHVRPILNLKQQEDVEIFRSISAQVFDLVREYGGSWSGEHGDGLVRSYKNREFFGEQLYQAFLEVKKAFDPLNLMNPGKIVEAQDLAENLRIDPAYRPSFPETHFHFREEQGFDRAIEMCTGVGHCRKSLGGTMCPSYMATRDEEHSTRGRANALRLAMTGHLGPEGLTSSRLYDVLDLCLECKGCKAECPSGVDMARLKAEFLAHYFERHGLPLGKRIFASARRSAEWASRLPGLANWATGTRLSRWLLEKAAGIDRRRTLPRHAEVPFLQAWNQRKRAGSLPSHPPAVLLFVDTFTNFFEPRIAEAAVRLLEALRVGVEVLDAGCCGRPQLSCGLLKDVKQSGAKLVRRLQNGEENGGDLPILVLEPSCLSTLRDDFPDLMDDGPAARAVAERVISLDEFLARPDLRARLEASLGNGPAQVLFHGHCQQKALIGTARSLEVLSALKECQVTEVDSGCCGMAGSFGYEKKHYGLSEKIGARRLFPAVKKADDTTRIVASGFSCRAQIEHFTGKRAHHLAEVLASALTGPEKI